MGNKKDTKETKKDKELFIDNIIHNYRQIETSIVDQLSLYNRLHPTTTGTLREDIWMQLFEMIVPKKFVIEHSIFIIDSGCHISKEVDLAIIDNTYTPYIFQYGRLKYVPIEAVAAVVECKSTKVPYKTEEKDGEKTIEVMKEWCESIEALRTSTESVVRMATGLIVEGESYSCIGKSSMESTQKSTRPIRIFCGYETDLTKLQTDAMKSFFDFILIAKEKDSLKRIEISFSEKNLFEQWFKELNYYGIEDNKKKMSKKMETVLEKLDSNKYNMKRLSVKSEGQEISLLSFNFQLNQLLMIINNPILFPHFSYANMFNKIYGNEQKNEIDKGAEGKTE